MATDNVIHTAINNGHFHQVRFLIDKGADVNERDSSGRTPLILCSFVTDTRWSVGLSRLLLEHEARISKCDRQGFNALHHACINQRYELVSVYLAALDCDVHSRCKKGNTSLHYAASLGNKEIVKMLTQLVLKYKLTLNPINKMGLTPLHQAFRANQIDCGDLLIEYGADITLLDTDKKPASQLRQEAVERLNILAQQNTRSRPSSRKIRKIKKEAESEKPKQEAVEITVAKNFDLRNDPKYVFETTAVDYFHAKDSQHILKRRSTAPEGKPKLQAWKEQITALWNHYETRFSNSYRAAAKPLPLNKELAMRCNSIVSSIGTAPSMSRKRSIVVPHLKTSRSDSLTNEGTNSRRSSVTNRRNGMLPLVKTQSRPNF
ncbi:E3 ubiquitin-protein ligase MIB2-like [Watersipora subatra]|uniref:E3 ubiquitin-protein ligase MIB2-like n=1 Tax=Watersipora subatra TaxID=2589382 RepID=UPI00355C49D2